MNLLEILQELYPYILLLFFGDAFAYFHHRHLAIVSYFGNYCRLRSQTGGQFFGLFPTEKVFYLHSRPIIFTEKGIYFVANEADYERAVLQWEDFRFFPYDKIKSVVVERKALFLDDNFSIKMPSVLHARYVGRQIKLLRTLKPDAQKAYVQKMHHSRMDTTAITKKLENLPDILFRLLAAFSILFYLYLFLVLPFLIYIAPNWDAFDLSIVNYRLVLQLFALNYVLVFVLAIPVYQRLYHDQKGQLLYTMMILLFAPVSAGHIINHLTRDYLVHYDYIGIAAILLPKNDFIAMLRRERHQTNSLQSEACPADVQTYWQTRQSLLSTIMQEKEIDEANLETSPDAVADKSAAAFCPLCQSTYRKGYTTCSDCNVPLKALHASGAGS